MIHRAFPEKEYNMDEHARGNERCVTSDRARTLAWIRHNNSYGKLDTLCSQRFAHCWHGDYGVWWDDDSDGVPGEVRYVRAVTRWPIFAPLIDVCSHARTLH